MEPNNKSHDEAWDDTSLIDSWNEALQEYREYHSIAARGEKIANTLRDYQDGHHNAILGSTEFKPNGTADGEAAMDLASSSAEDEYEPPLDIEQNITGVQNITQSTVNQCQPVSTVHVSGAPTVNMPQALLTPVEDETVKNVMISWYYAGYYTGLYEGQQKVSR